MEVTPSRILQMGLYPIFMDVGSRIDRDKVAQYMLAGLRARMNT